MKAFFTRVFELLAGDAQTDRAVPPTGYTARLTLLTSGAMAFLAVFALALSAASLTASRVLTGSRTHSFPRAF